MKVRAIADGTYAGYYRVGPSDDGSFLGEVFEIDPTPFEVRHPETGKVVPELDEDGKKIPVLDNKGKPELDEKGKPMFKPKTATWFSRNWMERVSEDTPITFDYDEPVMPILPQYREKKKRTVAAAPGTGIHSPAPVNSVI